MGTIIFSKKIIGQVIGTGAFPFFSRLLGHAVSRRTDGWRQRIQSVGKGVDLLTRRTGAVNKCEEPVPRYRPPVLSDNTHAGAERDGVPKACINQLLMQTCNLHGMGHMPTGEFDDRQRASPLPQSDKISDVGMLGAVPSEAIVGVEKNEVRFIQVCNHRIHPLRASWLADRSTMKSGFLRPKVLSFQRSNGALGQVAE